MIAISSSIIGYAYQLLFILYHGKYFLFQFSQLIHLLSKVMLFGVYCICCGNTTLM